MHLKAMISKVRGMIEQPGLGYWTDGDIVTQINESNEFLESFQKDARKEGYFGTWVDISLSSSTGYVELPSFIEHVQGVQLTDVSGKPFAKKAVFDDGVVRAIDSGDQVSGGPTGFVYDTWGRKLYVSPATGGNVRIYYVGETRSLLFGLTPSLAASVTGLPLAATDDSSIGQFAAELETDIYAGVYVQITALPTGYTGSIQVGTKVQIASYASSGRLATVTPAFVAALPAGSEYAFIPTISKQAHQLVCLHAAIGLRMSKDEPYQHLQGRFDSQLAQFLSSLEDFVQEPEEIEPFDPEFGYV